MREHYNMKYQKIMQLATCDSPHYQIPFVTTQISKTYGLLLRNGSQKKMAARKNE
jgi:hypothetical protein